MTYTTIGLICPPKRKKKRHDESQLMFRKRLENEFCENIIKENLKYNGKVVKIIDKHKRTYSEIFNHICTDHQNKKASINIGRMQTSHLVYTILSKCENCTNIVCIPDKSKKNRINILCIKLFYKIVLQYSAKDDLYYFITSYPIKEAILNNEIKKATRY